MSDLRQRVEDAIMPNHNDPNAEAEADAALAVVADWLREQAAGRRRMAPDYRAAGDERQYTRLLAQAVALESAADEIARKP